MLEIGSQKPTVLLLIWLMCFLTKAFAAGLSRYCGQGYGPHLIYFNFFIYTTFTTLIKGRKKLTGKMFGMARKIELRSKLGVAELVSLCFSEQL